MIFEKHLYIYQFFKDKNYYDPCPTKPQFDGLKTEWKKYNFVNPPYSQIKTWIQKALTEKQKGKTSILLIPARTDTQWFRTLIENNVTIMFIQGRLHFNESAPAPFPSMFVKITPNAKKTKYQFIKKEELKNFTSKQN